MKKTATLAEILSHLIHKHSIRPSQLAKLTGVPQPTVHRMVTGTCPKPHKSSLTPIADYFDLTVEQLKGKESIPGLNIHKLDSSDGWAAVPLVDWNHLSTWPLAEYDYQLTEHGVQTQKRKQTMTYTDADISTKAFATYITNDYASNQFPTNTLTIFDPEKTPQNGCYVLLRNNDGNVSFCQMLLKNGQSTFTMVKNTISSTSNIKHNDAKIIGVLAQARIDY